MLLIHNNMENKYPKYPKGKIMLNLGCGSQRIDGYIGIDNRDCGQEMIWDVRGGIPFPDNSVDEVYSCHFVEHLTDRESTKLFKEIYRVLKPKGQTHHRCPHSTHPTACYWGHETFWNEAKISAIIRVPGLDKFNIIENKKVEGELFFAFSKMK